MVWDFEFWILNFEFWIDLKILSALLLILGLIFAGIYLFETNEQGYEKDKDTKQVIYKGEPEDKGVAYWKKKYSKK